MKVRREEIRVFKEDEPVVVLARETRHGPIITDEGAFAGYRGFALNPQARVPHEPRAQGPLPAVDGAAAEPDLPVRGPARPGKELREFRDALRLWDIPSQNFIYADVDGNIGYQTPGLIPIRKNGDGSLPSPGWTDDYEWTGFIPFDDLPSSYNPPKGYIVTANNPVTSRHYRYFLGDGFRPRIPGAADRGHDREEPGRKISDADVEAMQGDTLNISGAGDLPYLKAPHADGSVRRRRGTSFEQWDVRMDPGERGAAV